MGIAHQICSIVVHNCIHISGLCIIEIHSGILAFGLQHARQSRHIAIDQVQNNIHQLAHISNLAIKYDAHTGHGVHQANDHHFCIRIQRVDCVQSAAVVDQIADHDIGRNIHHGFRHGSIAGVAIIHSNTVGFRHRIHHIDHRQHLLLSFFIHIAQCIINIVYQCITGCTPKANDIHNAIHHEHAIVAITGAHGNHICIGNCFLHLPCHLGNGTTRIYALPAVIHIVPGIIVTACERLIPQRVIPLTRHHIHLLVVGIIQFQEPMQILNAHGGSSQLGQLPTKVLCQQRRIGFRNFLHITIRPLEYRMFLVTLSTFVDDGAFCFLTSIELAISIVIMELKFVAIHAIAVDHGIAQCHIADLIASCCIDCANSNAICTQAEYHANYQQHRN